MAEKGKSFKITQISDIVGGKIDFQLKVRVINMWSTPDRSSPTDQGSVQMILIDEKNGKIHASIRKHLLPIFKDQIEEGKTYVFEKFMVAQNDPTFKTTNHKYKLNFMGGTIIFKVNATEIPERLFNFVPFVEILAAHKEDRLLDVIGHVVEKDTVKETVKNGKSNKVMDATLEDLEGNRIHCTLWDDYAVKMQQCLDTHDSTLPVVVVFQLCKLKKYYGSMGISNAFYGTKMLLNPNIPEVSDYVERMNGGDVELTQVVSQMTGPTIISLSDDLLQTPRKTIEDLLESSEKCVGTVLARTCELETDAGWFYRACSKCASRITTINGQIYCDKCSVPRTAVPRFKLNVQVMDNTGSTTFVLFDRIVSQTVGRSAQDFLDAMNESDPASQYPQELNMFVDKRMLFKVEVTDANLYRNWRSYTVKKLTQDEDVIKKFISQHGISLGNDEEEAAYVEAVSKLADDDPLEKIEEVDSSNKDELSLSESAVTPTSKSPGKRSIDSVETLDVNDLGECDASTTKGPKIVRVKIEDDK